MSDSASVLLQKAVFGVISNDAGVKAVLGDPAPIYDKVPGEVAQAFAQGSGKTYVAIGGGRELPQLADDFTLTEHILQFEIWGYDIGMVKTKNAADAIASALTTAFNSDTLIMAGYAISLCDRHGAQWERHPSSPLITLGTLSMRLLISSTT
jgi:hypothetical protein